MRFGGLELDAESGLNYAGARYYRNTWGRFLSVDPVGGTLTNPQRWNGYAYALNNPLRFVDPSGTQACVTTDDGSGPSTTCEPEPTPPDFWFDPNFCNTPHGQRFSECEGREDWRAITPDAGGPEDSNDGSCNLCSGGSSGTTPSTDPTPQTSNRPPEPVRQEPKSEDDAEPRLPDLTNVQVSQGGMPNPGKLWALLAEAAFIYSKKTGFEWHHIRPIYLGGKDMINNLVRLPASYHQMITNAFRSAAPYGHPPPAEERIHQIMRDIYARYPIERFPRR
jgi:RHS repeat-associated protein